MKKLSLCWSFLFFSFTFLQANNSLRINNPNWWGEYLGTIEEAVFMVEPKGIYMEVGMYLTFSAKDLGYGPNDSLEVVLDFDLPEGSIIHDSWLWIDNIIMKADILDIWTATAIYEEIVDRRRDPSLLYKKPGGGYQIRIYPLLGNQTRKVKITYLVPAVWNGGSVSASLPTEILLTSSQELTNFKVITRADPNWSSPVLDEYPGQLFQNETLPQIGDVLSVTLPFSAAKLPLTFSATAPLNNGVFVSRWEEASEKFYQIAYLPEPQSYDVSPKKYLLIFDHNAYNTYIEAPALWSYVKKMLKENLSSQDSFNIIFAKPSGNPVFMSQNWISGEVAALEAAFALHPSPIVHANKDETELLLAGINFIKNKGGTGNIFFIASSSKTGSWNANNKVTQLANSMTGFNIPIHVINYQTEDFYSGWQNPIILQYTNQDFYKKITQLTSGNLFSSLDGGGPVWETILQAFTQWKTEPAIFDLYPAMNGGFTYQRFHQTYLGQSHGKNRPILQTGKYQGNFPMVLQYSSLGPAGLVFEIKTIEETDVIEADTLSREAWVGHYIHTLEGGNPGNSTIDHIINVSIAERVLSNYTAFLALEPNMQPCMWCWNSGGGLVDVNDEKPKEWSLQAFPNPFTDRVNIEINTGGGVLAKDVEIQVFDALGRWVQDLTKQAVNVTDGILVQWDGTGPDGRKLSPGVYFVSVKNGKQVSNLKLILVR